MEAERIRLQQERSAAADRAKIRKGLRSLTNQDVQAMLEFSAKPLEGMESDIPYLRRTLAALVRRIELDPENRTAQVHSSVSGVGVASPRGFGVYSGDCYALTLYSSGRFAKRAPRRARPLH